MEFRSNSARRSIPENCGISYLDVATFYRKIMWYGDKIESIFNLCASFDTQIVIVDDDKIDNSVIAGANMIVINSNNISERFIALTSFACEFGIPVVWIGDLSLSDGLRWRIKSLPGDISPLKFWEVVQRCMSA